MNHFKLIAVLPFLSFFSQQAAAIDTPDDTYFDCGVYLVAMETSWLQRRKNEFKEHSSLEENYVTVNTDFVKLRVGEPIDRLDPQRTSKAFSDRIELFTGESSKINRRSAILYRRENVKVEKLFSNPDLLLPPETERRWVSYPCEIVTEQQINATITEHNQPLGELKF